MGRADGDRLAIADAMRASNVRDVGGRALAADDPRNGGDNRE
jgi:hypothetical protein